MILGLCESPITFNAIIDWSTALNEGTMQLREILDLDAMLSKDPTPEQVSETARTTQRRDQRKDRRPVVQGRGRRPRRRRPTRRTRKAPSAARRRPVEEEEEDNTLSLAQMEEQLKPQALERFAHITALYSSSPSSSRPGSTRWHGGELSAARSASTRSLREELTAQVESVQFHDAKIEYLVDQLYAFNRRLTALGGQMLRLAERHKVPARTSSIAMSATSWTRAGCDVGQGIDKKWTAFAATEVDAVDRIRIEIAEIARRRAWRFPSSAASSTWCRRASARPGSPRRRWSRPTSAS